MATALRPISHDDRLSLVEHLDELRSRIIICLVIVRGAFAICFWQNDRILDIMNRPLQKSTFHKDSQDPLEQSAAFQQSLKQLSLQLAIVSREMARIERREPGAAGAVRVVVQAGGVDRRSGAEGRVRAGP